MSAHYILIIKINIVRLKFRSIQGHIAQLKKPLNLNSTAILYKSFRRQSYLQVMGTLIEIEEHLRAMVIQNRKNEVMN